MGGVGRSGSRSDPDLRFLGLLALAAAIGAAVLAAGLSALVLAAVVAINSLCLCGGGLRESGANQNDSERKKCDCAFHGNLLNVRTAAYKSSLKA